jgi:hypothetical protein
MTLHHTRPLTVDAQQWTGHLTPALADWLRDDLLTPDASHLDTIDVRTADGTATARPGWWLVRLPTGRLMVSSPTAFNALLEAA